MNFKLIAVAASLLASPALMAGELNYIGSSTVGKFISDAAGAYSGSAFKIDTKPESGGGRRCAAAGSCDIGGVAGDIGSEFEAKGVQATLIGQDAIAAIVGADNPVSGLSSAQLKGIFTGQIKNWSEVGGPDLAIRPFVVKKGSATRSVFRKKVLGGADYAGVKVVTPDAKIVATVARSKGAIGQISFAFIQDAEGIKPLAIDGQEASVRNPAYPVTRPLNLATKGAPAGETKAFLDWALSPEGQQLVTKYFIGVN